MIITEMYSIKKHANLKMISFQVQCLMSYTSNLHNFRKTPHSKTSIEWRVT